MKKIAFTILPCFVATVMTLADNDYGFTNLKKVSFGDIDYLECGAFENDSIIEEIEFNGIVGNFCGPLAVSCPNLRKIVFHGPIITTSGTTFASDCPQLDSVIVEGPVLWSYIDELIEKSPNLQNFSTAYLERLADWQTEVLTVSRANPYQSVGYVSAKVLTPILETRNSEKAAQLKGAMEYARNINESLISKHYSKLDILKDSPTYEPDSISKPNFRYAQPSDSLLTLTRLRFNLDSIAGTGDDISRIKNLLYWVHDNIPHNGSNGMAPGPRNLRNTYDSARRNNCGYNCRTMGICLAEALLAEGIPARYLTCQSKDWDTDNDCHVICIAWSESLGKWIWVDPTFAAYVTDENGLLLHPGEVRYRLQHDLPLILNEDANWNHQVTQTVDYYLEEYMAKNLYIMSANLVNQAEPESEKGYPKGAVAALVPLNSNYTNAYIITTDDRWFWQPPEVFERTEN